MAKDTKSPEMIELLDKISEAFDKPPRSKAIQNNTCSWCGGDATRFRDTLSLKEYGISGFCQHCQDETFGEEDE